MLIASINAIAVGYLVFSGHVSESTTNFLDRLRDAPVKLTVIALILVIIIVIATKALTGRGTPLRGGLPSGHAAVAFAAWMAVTLIARPDEHRFFVSTIMFAWRCSSPRRGSSRASTRRSRSSTAALLGARITLVVFQLFF